jgi:hypothetical protein
MVQNWSKSFSQNLWNDQGEDVSTLEIKKILQNTIEEEDKKKPFQTINLPKSKEKGYQSQEEPLQNTENNSIFQWREWGRCKIVDFWFSF